MQEASNERLWAICHTCGRLNSSAPLPSPLPLWCANPSATATSAGPLVFKQPFGAYLQYPRVVLLVGRVVSKVSRAFISVAPRPRNGHVRLFANCAHLIIVSRSLIFYSRFPSLLEIELIFRQPLSTHQLKWWSVFPANCISFYTILSVCKIFMSPPRPLPPFKNYAWGWVVLIPLRREWPCLEKLAVRVQFWNVDLKGVFWIWPLALLMDERKEL